MTKTRALQVIRAATEVYGWVRVTENDARYMRLYKKDAAQWIRAQESNELLITTTTSGAVWLD